MQAGSVVELDGGTAEVMAGKANAASGKLTVEECRLGCRDLAIAG